MTLMVKARVPKRCKKVVKINVKNMTFARKTLFFSVTPLYSVMTDIENQGPATCSYPLHDKLPLKILKPSAVASTVCSQKKLPGENEHMHFIMNM